MSAGKALVCAALAAAAVLVSAAVAGGSETAGSSATYRDPVDDAGAAPDIATVTLTQLDAATLGVTITLAQPTDLGRSGWIVVGIDTDRNQRSGGMHGSEAIVFVNGERAVLFRFGAGLSRVPVRLTRSEVTFTLSFADLRVRTFDFAVATLRQNADVAPDRGVFTYPTGPSRHEPARGSIALSQKR